MDKPQSSGKANGLPDDASQSLFQDNRGRIWASSRVTDSAYFKDGRFVARTWRA